MADRLAAHVAAVGQQVPSPGIRQLGIEDLVEPAPTGGIAYRRDDLHARLA